MLSFTAITQGNIPFILSFFLSYPSIYITHTHLFFFFDLTSPHFQCHSIQQLCPYGYSVFKHNSSFYSTGDKFYAVAINVCPIPISRFLFKYYTRIYSIFSSSSIQRPNFIQVLFAISYSHSMLFTFYSSFYSHSIHILFYFFQYGFSRLSTNELSTHRQLQHTFSFSASHIHWIMILSQRWIRSVEHA